MFQSTSVIADGRIAHNFEDEEDSSEFQSTSVIADGRISSFPEMPFVFSCFNPRPSLLTDESLQIAPSDHQTACFNPRPSLLTDESDAVGAELEARIVSIHVRHC